MEQDPTHPLDLETDSEESDPPMAENAFDPLVVEGDGEDDKEDGDIGESLSIEGSKDEYAYEHGSKHALDEDE